MTAYDIIVNQRSVARYRVHADTPEQALAIYEKDGGYLKDDEVTDSDPPVVYLDDKLVLDPVEGMRRITNDHP